MRTLKKHKTQNRYWDFQQKKYVNIADFAHDWAMGLAMVIDHKGYEIKSLDTYEPKMPSSKKGWSPKLPLNGK